MQIVRTLTVSRGVAWLGEGLGEGELALLVAPLDGAEHASVPHTIKQIRRQPNLPLVATPSEDSYHLLHIDPIVRLDTRPDRRC